MPMIIARACTHVDSSLCMHVRTCVPSRQPSQTGRAHAWVHTHSETYTGGGCGRWNLSHRDQSCGWCFCPDFRGSTLHFEQGNVWGTAHPGLQLKGQCVGPFLASAPALHLLPNWSQPSCVSSGLFLPLTLPSAPLNPHRWGGAGPLGP